MPVDLVVVNPGGAGVIYQDLERELTAVEPPLWCRLIAGYVRDRGHSVTIFDVQSLPAESAARKIGSPVLVCIAVYGHQPSASTQSMEAASELCRAIKTLNPDQPIIIVGGHVAALPERTLAEESVDYVCTGEGPVTVEMLLACLKADCPVDPVPGLLWAGGRTEAAPLITDLSELHGDAWDLLPMGTYRAHNWQCFDGSPRQPYASVYTSLGCPYRCVFCCINAPFGVNRYRMRKPEDVVAEITMLHDRYGVKTFKIIDEMFVLNPRHVTAICEGLAARPWADELNIWAYARIDTVKADQLDLLRKAGIRWLALGIESGSEHVRDGAEKSFTEDDIRQVVWSIQKAGINVIGNFIFGLPDDTMETMKATLDLAKELNCEFSNFYSAMAYPGSPLHGMTAPADLPERWSGYSQHSRDTKPLPTVTLSSRDVLKFRDEAFHEYFTNPRYLDMIGQKFGPKAVDHIARMTAKRLERAS